ncbi:type I secretion system permease/ATPase [uncultured Phenylobacterium sp.]|uniref:type I secretion system permease/ATPase n=1 Tax=uncultured Phenylobacterium sp. TaxID=349273 RepID=UPI0025CCFEAC|nr:type I secretion system permease/ATPase [uncultured Phenylobacterium sp.]
MYPVIGMAVVFSFFINLLALVSPLFMLQVYDRVLTSRNVLTLVFLTLIALFLLAIYAVLETLRTQVLVRGGVQFDASLRDRIYRGALEVNLKRRGGNEAQAFRDVDSVREFLTGAGILSFCDVPWIPLFVGVAFVLHPYFGILAIIAGALIFGLAVANDYITRDALKRATVAGIAAQNDVSATLRNSEVMYAMGMWAGLMRRWKLKRDEMIAWQATGSDRGGGVMSGIRFARQAVQTLILGGGAFLAIDGKISPGAMIAASIIVGRALAPIEAGVGQWKTYLNARGAWDRLQSLFDATDDSKSRMALPTPTGRLSAEALVVAPPGLRTPTLRGATFTLEAGATLAIVGPSAAGKSSLVRALVGVWPALAGEIRLDGSELKHWDPQALGSHIGYLPQDVELFSGTVAENIARFNEVHADEVIAAAKLAGVHGMIQDLPEGYETQIGDGGAGLSGGQRQRIALARAVYRQPPLIVLDEPNASLDATGEAALIETLKILKAARKTVVFVTHKTNLLSLSDTIMILRDGVVASMGPRDQILRQLVDASKVAQASAKA